MSATGHGQVIVPTGGKTSSVEHAKHLLNQGPKTIVVVAPRILLANQLSEEFYSLSLQHGHTLHTATVVKLITSQLGDKLALFNNTTSSK